MDIFVKALANGHWKGKKKKKRCARPKIQSSQGKTFNLDIPDDDRNEECETAASIDLVQNVMKEEKQVEIMKNQYERLRSEFFDAVERNRALRWELSCLELERFLD